MSEPNMGKEQVSKSQAGDLGPGLCWVFWEETRLREVSG